jgi:Tfp pilus assembly protein PilX
MIKRFRNERGIALLVVIATVLVVMILAIVILQIISSSSRLTHHQVSRVQAIYATQAAINYAKEMVRQKTAGWIPSPDIANNTVNRTMCRSGCDYNEADLPFSINQININIGGEGSGLNGVGRLINATANFTYTP